MKDGLVDTLVDINPGHSSFEECNRFNAREIEVLRKHWNSGRPVTRPEYELLAELNIL